MKTKVINDEWNGKPIFKIFEIDKEGNVKDEKRSVVGFGIKKAKAILNHLDELEKFVKENE